MDLKARNIRVNAVSPGPIDTPIFNTLGRTEKEVADIKEGFASHVPLGRIGASEDIAKAVSFLASTDSSFVTGTELFVDGGMAQI